MSEKTGLVECAVCEGLFSPKNDGTLRRHRSWSNDGWWCPGSEQHPKQHVHLCKCGVRWDEDVAVSTDA